MGALGTLPTQGCLGTAPLIQLLPRVLWPRPGSSGLIPDLRTAVVLGELGSLARPAGNDESIPAPDLGIGAGADGACEGTGSCSCFKFSLLIAMWIHFPSPLANQLGPGFAAWIFRILVLPVSVLTWIEDLGRESIPASQLQPFQGTRAFQPLICVLERERAKVVKPSSPALSKQAGGFVRLRSLFFLCSNPNPPLPAPWDPSKVAVKLEQGHLRSKSLLQTAGTMRGREVLFPSKKRTENVHLPSTLGKLEFQWFIVSCRRKFQLLCSWTL